MVVDRLVRGDEITIVRGSKTCIGEHVVVVTRLAAQKRSVLPHSLSFCLRI